MPPVSEKYAKILLLFAVTLLLLGCAIPRIPIKIKGEPDREYHAHADIKIILLGATFDFNKSVFMSSEGHELSEDVHMHDYNPHVIHFHNPKSTLGDFFRSVGMSINERCIDTGADNYCSNGTTNLYVYVNSQPLFLNYDTYIPNDLDKIFIYYGEGFPSQDIINGVTSESCIYSKRCLPPPGFDIGAENCSGSGPCKLE